MASTHCSHPRRGLKWWVTWGSSFHPTSSSSLDPHVNVRNIAFLPRTYQMVTQHPSTGPGIHILRWTHNCDVTPFLNRSMNRGPIWRFSRKGPVRDFAYKVTCKTILIVITDFLHIFDRNLNDVSETTLHLHPQVSNLLSWAGSIELVSIWKLLKRRFGDYTPSPSSDKQPALLARSDRASLYVKTFKATFRRLHSISILR
jgi:hypothetical protein